MLPLRAGLLVAGLDDDDLDRRVALPDPLRDVVQVDVGRGVVGDLRPGRGRGQRLGGQLRLAQADPAADDEVPGAGEVVGEQLPGRLLGHGQRDRVRRRELGLAARDRLAARPAVLLDQLRPAVPVARAAALELVERPAVALRVRPDAEPLAEDGPGQLHELLGGLREPLQGLEPRRPGPLLAVVLELAVVVALELGLVPRPRAEPADLVDASDRDRQLDRVAVAADEGGPFPGERVGAALEDRVGGVDRLDRAEHRRVEERGTGLLVRLLGVGGQLGRRVGARERPGAVDPQPRLDPEPGRAREVARVRGATQVGRRGLLEDGERLFARLVHAGRELEPVRIAEQEPEGLLLEADRVGHAPAVDDLSVRDPLPPEGGQPAGDDQLARLAGQPPEVAGEVVDPVIGKLGGAELRPRVVALAQDVPAWVLGIRSVGLGRTRASGGAVQHREDAGHGGASSRGGAAR